MIVVVTGLAWLLVAVAVALVVGGGIRLADRYASVTADLAGLPVDLTVDDILGRHAPQPRPESEFAAEAVLRACVEHATSVEINFRPERFDPSRRLLTLAEALGCDFFIDTDAHAAGQLDSQDAGCVRAIECGVPTDRVINTRTAEELLG